MPTWRNFNSAAFLCALYEAQDVLAETDEVDLIHLEPRWGLRVREELQRLLLYRDPSNTLMFANPGVKRVRLTRDYDLFVVVCQSYWDLLYVNAIDGWKDRCRTSVCWIDEMWAADVSGYKNWLRALDQFDHICLGFQGTVRTLSEAIARPCHWVAGAVDAFRFSPYPSPPVRVVDVHSVGRRWEGIHEALLRLSRSEGVFYLHDTLQHLSSMKPIDNRQHRDLFANIAKRSTYSVVAPAKMSVPEHTHGQVEMGHRYYEGSSAGAVLIGQAARCEAFRQMFDWPDAVLEVNPDGSDVAEILSSLKTQRDRLEQISQRNSAESLLRHDWVYRWKQIYEIAGLEASPGMADRGRELAALASLARAGSPIGGAQS